MSRVRVILEYPLDQHPDQRLKIGFQSFRCLFGVNFSIADIEREGFQIFGFLGSQQQSLGVVPEMPPALSGTR